MPRQANSQDFYLYGNLLKTGEVLGRVKKESLLKALPRRKKCCGCPVRRI